MLATAAPNATVAQEKVVRMGYQKVGAFALLKVYGISAELRHKEAEWKRLAPDGVSPTKNGK